MSEYYDAQQRDFDRAQREYESQEPDFNEDEEDHEVWDILKKDKYTAAGQKEIEDLYDRIKAKSDLMGLDGIRSLYSDLNSSFHETFTILGMLCKWPEEGASDER